MTHTALEVVTHGHHLQSFPHLHGRAGNFQTAHEMVLLVLGKASPDDLGYRDLALRDLAARISRNAPGHDDRAVVESLFVFARDRITYRKDPYRFENLQSARETLDKDVLYGDCTTKSIVLASMCAALGYRVRFMLLSYNPPEFQHVYVQVLIKGQWIDLDPTPENSLFGWYDKHALYLAPFEIFPKDEEGAGVNDWAQAVGLAIQGGTAAYGLYQQQQLVNAQLKAAKSKVSDLEQVDKTLSGAITYIEQQLTLGAITGAQALQAINSILAQWQQYAPMFQDQPQYLTNINTSLTGAYQRIAAKAQAAGATVTTDGTTTTGTVDAGTGINFLGYSVPPSLLLLGGGAVLLYVLRK